MMNLYAVHRLLIWVFIVASALFGVVMLKRWFVDHDTTELACGIGACVVTVGALAYVLSAPYLKRK